MNKDFYDKLPGCVCAILDELITDFGNEDWFETAWEEYRQHVLTTSMDDIRLPDYMFKKYTEKY